MDELVSKTDCCGCGACYSICPQKCIDMKPDKLGFLYPVIDEDKCIHCSACELVCPVFHKGEESKTPEAWAGHVKSEALRRASSSGGVFSAICEKILSDGGIIFGAALNDDCKTVRHVKVETMDELGRLRGSKYVQSAIGDTYIEAREALKSGKKVLFSGTPCQIDGLRLFLKRDYENLITVEIICHGTPSPNLFTKYIKYMEAKLGGVIKKVSFRDEIGGVF